MTLVYVLNKDNTPLMPCKAVRARLLLKQGKAKVIRRTPFTIKLNYQIDKPVVKEMHVALDTGSGTIGVAVVDEDNKVYYMAEDIIRNDIKSKMNARRKYRRSRRNRKTRYRKSRFNNRSSSKRKDRLSVTLNSKINSHVRVINNVSKILPINKETPLLEIGHFDPAYLKDPTIKDKPYGYQEGRNYGFRNTKEYVKNRDKHTCQICKGDSKDTMLHVHHVIFRSKGGSDLENNLVTLCKTCQDKLHRGELEYTGKIKGNRSNLKHASHMNVIASQLKKKYPKSKTTFGYVTKENRDWLQLPKTHYMDAVTIGTGGDKPIFLTETVYMNRHVKHGRYQQTKGKRSETKLPKGKVKGFRTGDKVKYRGKYYFLKGTINGKYASLGDIKGDTIEFTKTSKYGKTPKLEDLKRISRARCTLSIETKIAPLHPIS